MTETASNGGIVKHDRHEDLPPPKSEVGVYGWVYHNLLYPWHNAVLTVIGGLIAARAAASGVSLEVHLTVVAVATAGSLAFVAGGLLRVDEDHDEPSASASAGPPPKRTSAARRALFALAISGGCAVTIELVSSDWAAFRLSEDLGTTVGFAGLGYVAFTSGMTIGRLGGDAVVMRIGDDRLLRLALAVSGIGLIGAAFVDNRWVVLASYVVAGLGTSTFFPKLYDDAARFRGRRGAGLAWLRTGSSMTALLIPTVVGVLASTSLSVGASTAIVTLPCIVVLLALSTRSGASAQVSSR